MSLDWLARGAGVDGQTLRSGVAELKNKACRVWRTFGGWKIKQETQHTELHTVTEFLGRCLFDFFV